jgi:hypothetical protein
MQKRERDRDDLVAVEHQRRQPEPRPHAIAATDTALPLHRHSDVLERGDVPTNRARVDAEPVGDLAPGDERPALQELEQVEEV